MKRILLSILSALICTVLLAQNDIVDIIKLKNSKGVIKGFISEQIPGVTVKIIPIEAVLKFYNDSISSILPKSNSGKDSIKIYVISLKGGSSVEGTIIEQSPKKWILLKTTNTNILTFKYDEIEKVCKETVNPNADIFKAYGVLDIVKTNDGMVQKGIIVEQKFGETIKIKGIDNNIFVFDVSDVKSISKEPLDNKKDIFKQSAFLDIVYLKNNSSLKGIIIDQNPGHDITIEMMGNSNFVQKIGDVLKFSKEINPNKEKDTIITHINEPDSIGECIYKENSFNRQINSYFYNISKKNNIITLVNAPLKAIDNFKVNKEISFIIKLGDKIDDIYTSIQILDVINLSKLKKLSIRSNNEIEVFSNSQSNVTFKIEKYGVHSIKLIIIPNRIGEYAIVYKGCKKIIFFGVES